MTSRRSGAVSRANMVHGSAGAQDSWYDVDAFMLDQVKEVLSKLSDGSIDDEIWGKIVIMERCKRVAKAYLRKTTVIVDGSEEEFDGRTLGFNYFHNSERDDHGEEIRAKIADGVILKMDLQGNIKGMARGAAPIVCQGWRGERHNCVSDRLIRQQGRLNATANEEEKAHKLFDMRKFKHSLEREIHEEMPDARSLLLKTCVRVALVKDGVDMPRTPCWFAIVNLVALDMLKEKIPNLRELLRIEPSPSAVVAAEVPAPTANPAMSQEALTQLIAAAVNQINKAGMSNVSADQISQLASTLNINSARSEATTINKRDRSRKPYHFSSSSLDSSGEDMTLFRNVEAPVIKPQKTKRAEPAPKTYSSEDFYDSGMEKTREKEKKKPSRAFPSRPRLHDALFTRSQSITSDYDSNREQFDSGSWSSTNSRGYKQDHSTSSSLASEFELIPREERVEPMREHREEEKKTSIPIVADKPSAPIILTLQVNSTPNQEKPDDIITDVNRYSIDNGDQTYLTEETPILTGQTSKTGQLSPNLGNSPKSDRIENQKPIYDDVCEEIYGSFSDKTKVECSENEAPPTIGVLPSMANEENDSGEVILASLNGSVMQRNYECAVQARSGASMEKHTPNTMLRKNSSPSFFSELRQVLHKRTSANRLPRNYSQPARPYAAGSGLLSGHQSAHQFAPPARQLARPCQLVGDSVLGTAIYGQLGPPRGLRRTPTESATYARPHQHLRDQHQLRDQQLPATCRQPSSLTARRPPARVVRTNSQPWTQHELRRNM